MKVAIPSDDQSSHFQPSLGMVTTQCCFLPRLSRLSGWPRFQSLNPSSDSDPSLQTNWPSCSISLNPIQIGDGFPNEVLDSTYLMMNRFSCPSLMDTRWACATYGLNSLWQFVSASYQVSFSVIEPIAVITERYPFNWARDAVCSIDIVDRRQR